MVISCIIIGIIACCLIYCLAKPKAPAKADVINTPAPPPGYVSVNINEFWEKYSGRALICIPGALADQLDDAELKGDTFAYVKESVLRDIDKKVEKIKREEMALHDCICRNNSGIHYEKEGKIEEAIKVYEENIEQGFPAMHSYTRLMIIYRRLKDYDNEQRVIHRAIEVYEKAGLAADDVEKWKLRMEKSKLLQSKTNKN